MLDLSNTAHVVMSQTEALILISGELDPDPEVKVSVRAYSYDGTIDIQISASTAELSDAQQLAARLGFGDEESHVYKLHGEQLHHSWSGLVMEHPVSVVMVQQLVATMPGEQLVTADDPGHPEPAQV